MRKQQMSNVAVTESLHGCHRTETFPRSIIHHRRQILWLGGGRPNFITRGHFIACLGANTFFR